MCRSHRISPKPINKQNVCTEIQLRSDVQETHAYSATSAADTTSLTKGMPHTVLLFLHSKERLARALPNEALAEKKNAFFRLSCTIKFLRYSAQNKTVRRHTDTALPHTRHLSAQNLQTQTGHYCFTLVPRTVVLFDTVNLCFRI